MSEIVKPYKVQGTNYWTNLVDSNTGESVNFEEVTTWYDGTPMDDSKADGVIYRKLPASVGGGYVRRVFDGYINLSWWGIKGDGVTDYTNLINIALAYARRVKVGVQIDPGTYIISAPIRINSTSGVVVNGYGATFKQKDQTAVTQLIEIYNSTDITVNGLTFDGNFPNETPPTGPGDPDGWVGIYVAGNSSNVLINDCTFYQIQTKCIALNITSGVIIRNCNFDSSQYHDGIYIWGETGATKDVLIEGCLFNNMARSGVFPDGAVDNVTISNCEFRRDLDYPYGSTSSSGVRTRLNANNLTVTGCRFQENITRSIWLRATAGNIIITNNQILSPTRTAIAIEAVAGDPSSSYVIDNLIITGNNILSAGTLASDAYIKINNNGADESSFCRNMLIANNLLTEPGGRALSIEGIFIGNASGGTVDSLKIENNIISGTPRHAVRIAGAATGSLSNIHISGNQIAYTGGRGLFVTGALNMKIDSNTCKQTSLLPIYVDGVNYKVFNNFIIECGGPGTIGGVDGTAYDNILIDTPITDWSLLPGAVNVGEDVSTRLFTIGEYYDDTSGATPDNLLSGRGVYHSALLGTPSNAAIPFWYIESRRILDDPSPRYYQTAIGIQHTVGSWDRWIRVYNSNTLTWSEWFNDRPRPAEASPDTATSPGAEYDQAEVQAILDELRDLKTKMRAAGLLES